MNDHRDQDNRPTAIRIVDDLNELLAPTRTVEQAVTWTYTPGTFPLRLHEHPVADQYVGRAQITHTVTGPALLDQVAAAVAGRTMNWDDTFSSVPQSKPSANMDAIAVYQRIDHEATLWAGLLGSPANRPLPDRLRGIVGATGTAAAQLLHGDADDRTIPKGGLQRAARGWLVSARVVTGWEKPTWAPNAPCPNIECERRGSIRIRLEQGIGLCTACGTFWDEDNLPRLGEYVRWASEHLVGARHWLFDAEGFPVECTECLLTREQMAERVGARLVAARSTGREPLGGRMSA